MFKRLFPSVKSCNEFLACFLDLALLLVFRLREDLNRFFHVFRLVLAERVVQCNTQRIEVVYALQPEDLVLLLNTQFV